MKTYLLSLPISLLAIMGGLHPATPDVRGYCEFTMSLEMPAVSRGTTKMPGRTMRVYGKAWQQGERARIDTAPAGKASGNAMIVTHDALYTLQPSRKQALMKSMTPELHEKMFGGFPLLFLTTIDPAKRWKDATKVGTETVDGTVCDIWKVNLPTGPNQVASIWLPRSNGPSYPVRAVITVPTPQYANGKLTNDGPTLKCTVTAVTVKHGTAVPQSRFAVPTGYSVQVADARSR